MQIPRFQTTLKDYQNNIDQLVKTMLNHSINVILMSPFHLEPNRNDDLRKAVDSYNVFLKQYAKQHNLLFIDLQSAFDELLKQTSVYVLSQDRIHVNMAGHMFIKDTILKHIG
jgi:lysophospholipase L1-like esterase